MELQKVLALSAGYDGTAWALDATGTLFESSLDRAGDQPQRVWVSRPSEKQWAHVAAGGAHDAWCIDATGDVFRVASSATGLQVTAVEGGALSRISVGADGATWGIDAAGVAFVHDPAQGVWRKQAQPQPFSRISVGDASHVMATGIDGTAYELVSGAWSGIGQSITEASAASDGSAWAVGKRGNLFFPHRRRVADTGALFKSISAGSLSNVWASTPRQCRRLDRRPQGGLGRRSEIDPRGRDSIRKTHSTRPRARTCGLLSIEEYCLPAVASANSFVELFQPILRSGPLEAIHSIEVCAKACTMQTLLIFSTARLWRASQHMLLTSTIRIRNELVG